LEKPIQSRLPGCRLRDAQLALLPQLPHELAGRIHRDRLPPLPAEAQILNNGQPILLPHQHWQPGLLQYFGPPGKPHRRMRRERVCFIVHITGIKNKLMMLFPDDISRPKRPGPTAFAANLGFVRA
jgi:hypothetical protein